MKKYAILICFWLSAFVAYSQEGISFDERYAFEKRVKQVEQFVGRFNGTENLKGEKIQVTKEADRKGIWTTLLSPNLKAQNPKFFQAVLDSKAQLSMNSNEIFALVRCKVRFEGKSESMNLTMQNEGDPQKGFRWAIRGAKADFLAVKAAKPKLGMVSPASHNLNFIDLKKALTSDKANLPNYAWLGYEPDYLTLVLYLIKTNQIQVEYVEDVSFFFLDIKDWVVRLDYFGGNENNSNANAGWLISDLLEHENTKKHEFKKAILAVH